MISIDRLEEMAIEELQTKLKNFGEQIKLQNNFIDSLLKATNNSEWLDKSMLDDEVSEVIEKIELDYEQLDQLKAENEKYALFIEKLCDYAGLECDNEEQAMRTLSDLASQMNKARWIIDKLKQTLVETKEIAEPYQKDIDKICGNCRRYDVCHACCMDDINCYQYKKGTTPACDKFMELKDFDINKLANQILQKISEVEDG